ncbi:MAG: hypothetical protein R3F60_09175 [bacterium]
MPAPLPALGHAPADTTGLTQRLQPLAPDEIGDRAPSASEQGFVPEGGLVDAQDALPLDVATLDVLDPEERAFKQAAGDLDAFLDEEELLKRQAITGDEGGAPTPVDTALADADPLAPSELEAHFEGRIAEAPRTSEHEAHHDGRRPTVAARSPTEGDALGPADLTTQDAPALPALPAGPLYAETRLPEPAVPTWEGDGTDTGGR